MRIWGDAVAFYGDGSSEQFANVSDALAKMRTKGKVEMDQLDRLFDAGIDAVGMYAQGARVRGLKPWLFPFPRCGAPVALSRVRGLKQSVPS